MKILVTGFDPFGGETVNPAYEAVKLLPDTRSSSCRFPPGLLFPASFWKPP